jgi:Carboxypeptidase regulatory-like domain
MAQSIATLLAALLMSAPAVAQQPTAIPAIPGGPGMPAGAPARDTGARTGTARIRGHVIAAENGTPLRKAQVRVTSPELRENRVTTTDAQGAYELKDLPAGRYTVTASKGSFVTLQYGQTRPLQQGRPLEVLDGQTLEKVDLALPRGSIVTGRIVDEFGEPIADVQVMPMRYQYMQGRRRLTPTGRGSQTNDIGEYRLFGLAPGQYYVSATLRNFSFGESDDRSGYAPTYYPGTANPSEAQRVNVDLGQTMNDVNFSLVATRTAKVSGVVLDSQGRPLSMGMVMAMPRGGVMMFGPSGNGQIRPDGSFAVSGLAPGEYTLRANAPPSGDGIPEFATADVTVNGDDVNGVRLATARMIIASGRVVFNDPAAAQSLRPSSIRLMGMPANPDESMMFMGGGGGAVKDDYTFEVRMPPGKMLIRLGGPPMPGWTIKAVRQNGVDVTDTGVEFTAGGDVGGLEVEFTNQVTEISGLVTNARGAAVKDYSVLVFSEDRDRWGGNTRYRAVGRPDQEGRFKIRTLPPGRYYVVAVEYLDPSDSGDPEYLDRVRTKATTLTVNEGETKVVDLRVQSVS